VSDTPETDAAAFDAFDGQGGEAIFTDLARKLERERNSLQDQRDFAMSEIERLRKERDEAERENEQLLASNKTYERDWPVLVHERNKALRRLEFIAEDCEAWLNSESDEPSMEFIKAVRDYARKAVNQ